MSAMDPAILSFVREAASSDRYAAYLRNTLVDLIAIDTAATADLQKTADGERQLFDFIEREVRECTGGRATIERVPIDAAIGGDPVYSPPGYAADAGGRVPPPEKVYAGRGNLIVLYGPEGGESRPGLILHAHVDVVPPWFGPRTAGERVFGRGACDNKAQVAMLLAQMRLLREIEEKFGRMLTSGLVYQFAIDEEIGGNGSLSLARDARSAGVPVLIAESSDLVPYCAHRGCVYYRCQLSVGRNTGMTAVELFPFVVMALESEGRRFQRETSHPGFTAAHVQTNHGVLGCYGEHPGNVCDHVAIELVARTNANAERMAMKLTQMFDEALAEYVRRYGDKATEVDPATGQPKVERHFQVKVLPSEETQNFRVDVWGKSGHMAAIRECDNAITKAALLFAALLKVAGKYPGIQAYGRLCDWAPGETGQSIVLEGGQGFTPSHKMADIQARMIAAAKDAVGKYCKLRHRKYDDSMVQMTFERLHNDAYADSPSIAAMQALRAASAAIGNPLSEPTAWETSCDARIYHHKGHEVAIFGAGKLHVAHSDTEHVDIPDVQKALAIMTLATLSMCNSASTGGGVLL